MRGAHERQTDRQTETERQRERRWVLKQYAIFWQTFVFLTQQRTWLGSNRWSNSSAIRNGIPIVSMHFWNETGETNCGYMHPLSFLRYRKSRKEQRENAESCGENLRNEIQLKRHKDRNRLKNRIKRSGQARLVCVKNINSNIPTTWMEARGDESLGKDFISLREEQERSETQWKPVETLTESKWAISNWISGDKSSLTFIKLLCQ